MRIGWISIGNDSYGSTRIGVTNIHKSLLSRGLYSSILSYNNNFVIDIDTDINNIKKEIVSTNINIVIFHKLCGEKTQDLLNFCKSKNIKTVYINGDWNDNIMYSLADLVIVGSPYIQDYLVKKYSLVNVHFIDDALEINSDTPFKNHLNKEILNIGWYGNYTKIDYTLDFLNSLNIKHNVITIANTPDKYKIKPTYCMGAGTSRPWDVDYLIQLMLSEIDIIVTPIDVSSPNMIMKNYAKTSNRITLPMSLGIPTISTPIPTYSPIIKNGINGFLCYTKEEWKTAITILEDAANRETIGKRDSLNIRNSFFINNIVDKWIEVLNAKT